MKIIVDAFWRGQRAAGNDRRLAAGAREYGVQILLVGERDKIEQCAKRAQSAAGRHRDFGGSGMIPVEADPTTLLKEYADSSMAVGMQGAQGRQG